MNQIALASWDKDLLPVASTPSATCLVMTFAALPHLRPRDREFLRKAMILYGELCVTEQQPKAGA